MANIKSSMKRAKTAKLRTYRNKKRKSAIKAEIKNFKQALGAGNIDDAKVALINAGKKLDKAVAKGVLHRNTASRQKSKLTRMFNKAI